MGEHSKRGDEKKAFVKHNFGQNMINYDGDDDDDDDNNLPTLFFTLCPLNLLWSMYKSVIIPYSRSSLTMIIIKIIIVVISITWPAVF